MLLRLVSLDPSPGSYAESARFAPAGDGLPGSFAVTVTAPGYLGGPTLVVGGVYELTIEPVDVSGEDEPCDTD